MTLPGYDLSDKALRTREAPISYLIAAAMTNPQLISLAAGLVDNQSLPVQPVAGLAEELLCDLAAGRAALQYGATDGLPELRELLLERFCRMDGCQPGDLSLTPDHCLVTNGSQQALYIIGDILLTPGDIAIVAAPTYFVYADTLESLGARVLSVPMDAKGMRTDLLAELLERLAREGQIERVKLIYEVTYYQNPTGLTLADERRRELVELAQRYSRKHRILVVADEAYRELRYDGTCPASLKTLDPGNEFVAVCKTFSKSFSAGLKTGYTFLPDDLVGPFLKQKSNHDFGSNNFTQHLLVRAIRNGTVDRHREVVCQAYRAKRDATLDALAEHLGDLAPQVEWTRPQGGMYVWLTLPPSIDTGREGWLFDRCIRKGVLYVPGAYCYAGEVPGGIPRNQMRLCYGVPDIPSLREGVRRLAEAIREALDQPAARSGVAERSHSSA